MNATPPKFNWRDTSKWRAVPLRETMLIAHRCTTGVNFQGCSKADIIEGVASPHGYTSDAPKFIAMMDRAEKVIPHLKEQYTRSVGEFIRDMENELKS